MTSNRIAVGVLSAAVLLTLVVGPAAGAQPSLRATVEGDDVVPVALQDLNGPGTYVHRSASGHSRTSVTQILSGIAGYRDLDVWLAAIGEAAAATSGREAMVAAPAGEETASESTEEDDEYTGTYADTADAGDLNGDGLGDVFAYHWDVGTWDAVLEARDGQTGNVLWERGADADGGIAWPLDQDLDGDDARDLLIYDLEILTDSWDDCDWDSDDGCWEEPWDTTFRWSIGLVSGRDGGTLWTRDLDGWIKESFDDAAEPSPGLNDTEYHYEISGENVDVLPFTGDLDGDGEQEIILNAIDVTERAAGSDTYLWAPVAGAGIWDGSYTIESATRATAIDGAGRDIRTFNASGGGRVSLVWPLEHAEGPADVVWEHALYPSSTWQCAYAYAVDEGTEICPIEDGGSDAFTLEVLDGATFEPRWSTTVEGWGFAWPLGGDLDGDGRTDLATWTLDDSWEERTVLLSGNDGEPLWNDEVVIRDVLAVTPLDATSGDDVLSVDYEENEPESEEVYSATVYFQRRNGATGALLSQTAHTVTDSEMESQWLYASVGGDGDGDGASDLTVGTLSYTLHEEDDELHFAYGPSRAVAESGATTETLMRLDHDSYARLHMAPDFDGDGLVEAFQQRLVGSDPGSVTIVAGPARLTDGATLWNDETSGDFVFHSWGQDADGDGGAEVYRHVDSVDARRHVSTLVTALSGRDGAARWSYTSKP